MDVLSIGAALAVTGGAAAAATATSANANQAAPSSALNYAYTILQAELRDVQKRLAAAETALAALTE